MVESRQWEVRVSDFNSPVLRSICSALHPDVERSGETAREEGEGRSAEHYRASSLFSRCSFAKASLLKKRDAGIHLHPSTEVCYASGNHGGQMMRSLTFNFRHFTQSFQYYNELTSP